MPARATSSFTTVAGQGWLVGLSEPALDAGTSLAYRRVGRQGGIGSSDRDGLFEQESGVQKHDRSSRAGCFWLESRWDSRIGQILIQPVGWAEASRNAKAIFARLA